MPLEVPDKGNSHGLVPFPLPRNFGSSNMQSLLSASENNVLQSFLSVMDYPDDTLTAKEWALLSSSSRSVPTSSEVASLVESATQNSDHKDALEKATKDLMALEPDHWRVQSAMQNMQDPAARGLRHHTMQLELHHRRQQSALGQSTSFSFSQGKLQLDPQLAHMNGVKPSPSSPSISHLSTSPTDDNPHHTVPQLSHQRIDSSSNGHLGSSSSPSSRRALHPSTSSSSAASSSSSHSTSTHTPIASSSTRNRASSSTSPTSSATPITTATQKQALLSPSQKKANHIQSEQKRRANIRRGYEALCETVPALREAIKHEEEVAVLMAETLNGGPGRKRRKKGQGKNSHNGEKDKVDGRAGPRSENVVLIKTIEHIQSMLSDRSALLARLHHARSMLPTGHPVLTPLQIDPPWERVWKGGEGKIIVDGEEEAASSEGEGYE